MPNAARFATILVLAWACRPAETPAGGQTETQPSGQAAVTDNESVKTIARIAAESPDHSTLVKALQAVSYVDVLANPGPFTVFAPVNAAFDKLPPGTVETLLKSENAAQLRTVLLHHVTTSAYATEDLRDGMDVGMVDGGPIRITREGVTLMVGGAKVIASVRASNGWVHVVDGVLVPPAK